MRSRLVCVLASCAIGCAVACAACAAGAPGPGIDSGRAIAHVEALTALGPRPGDSPQAQRAAGYIEAQLQAIGVAVERMAVGSVEVPAIDLLGIHRRSARVRVTTDPDLVTRFGPGGGKALLVMAHYDTVPTSPGGVDNAGAVAVVLELARVLAAAPPPAPVMLVFTANEEIGLVGAEALAGRRGDAIGFAVALDLIGGSGDLSLNGASRLIGAAELGWLARAADRAGVVVRAPLPHRVVSRAWPQVERSDHGPFTRRGIAAVHFYHRGQDGEAIDLAYHGARDTAARVERRALDEVGRLLRALTEVPPPAHDGDGFWVPLARNVVVPRWPLVALDVVLAALALGLLTTFPSTTSRARGGLGVIVGLVCYAAAIAATAAIERFATDGHPASWLHAPGPSVLAELALLAGAFGLATRAAGRFAPWVGDRRYLAIAIALPLSVGLGCLWLGAAELAWIWLVPAAGAAVAPRLGRLGLVAIGLSVLPGVLVLAPDQLREAAWNGFWPAGIPLAAWIGGFALAPLAALAWWLRKRPAAGPLGTLVLPLGCGLATIAGVTLLLQAHPPCSPQQFHDLHLACEAALGVR
jgi:Peptidase family M28